MQLIHSQLTRTDLENYFRTLANVKRSEAPYLHSFLQKYVVAKNHYDKWLHRNILVIANTDEDIDYIKTEFANYLAEHNESFISIRYEFLRSLEVERLRRMFDKSDTVIIHFDCTDNYYTLYDLTDSLLEELFKHESIVIICHEGIKEGVLQSSNEKWDFIFYFENRVLRMMGSNRYYKKISIPNVVNEEIDLYPTYYRVV